MREERTQEHPQSPQRKWVIILCVALSMLAIFWSVDPTIIYFLSGLAIFSFFKALQLSTGNAFSKANDSKEPDYTFKGREENSKPFLSSLSPEQRKTLLVLILGFVGFVLFFIVVGFLIDVVNTTFSEKIDVRQRASDHYYNQQYDSASYYYRLAIETDPLNADLWFERGNAFLNNQNSDSALVMYKQAVELKPDFEQAQYNIGYIYFDRKNYQEAILETKKILAYHADYVDAKLLIGDSYYNRSQLDSALQYYESAYKAGYRSAILCHLIAYIYDTKGQTNVAIDLYKEAIGQDSSIVDIYTRLGELVPGQDGEAFRQKAARLKAQ